MAKREYHAFYVDGWNPVGLLKLMFRTYIHFVKIQLRI